MQNLCRLLPHDVIDPLWTVVSEGGPFHASHERGRSPLADYLDRLEETGPASGAAELRKRFAEFL